MMRKEKKMSKKNNFRDFAIMAKITTLTSIIITVNSLSDALKKQKICLVMILLIIQENA